MEPARGRTRFHPGRDIVRLAVAIFCVLYGLSNGILTIVRGTVPQVLFGRENYGAISGALAGPSLVLKAAGPLGAATSSGNSASPLPLLGVLLLISLASLGCYITALKTTRRKGESAATFL
jgi:hypothetical protein